MVLDGFGIGPDPARDAIASASMPTWRGLLERWPKARLRASESAVGLPDGQMGNSEVGHLNLGAGRPVLQDLPRIDAAIADGSFPANAVLAAAVARAARDGSRLHLVSLVGPGGVHANDRHLVEVVRLARAHGVVDTVVHALLDGRDTPPRSALAFVADLEGRLAAADPTTRIATVGGRYFAMDRDFRWDRVARAWEAIVHGRGTAAGSATDAIERAYERAENDEFVAPTVIEGVDGRVRDGDVIVHLNFRADRARQLVHALVDGPDFDGFDRGDRPTDLTVVTMTAYEADLPVEVAFPPEPVRSLAQTVSELGWRQFHVAETEKYAHVTYFFNGGVEDAWPGEERLLVPSPQVATYDLQPEMSAPGVTDALVAALERDRYDLIVANYANADMVGHTGVWEAAVRAVETLDLCLARILAALPDEALLAITADHGNADEMRDPEGRPVTAHSLNPVPLVLVGSAAADLRLHDGVLADVCPTLLELAGLPRWDGMSGRSLLETDRPEG